MDSLCSIAVSYSGTGSFESLSIIFSCISFVLFIVLLRKLKENIREKFETFVVFHQVFANVQKPSFVPATLKNVATLAKLRKKILLKIRSLKDPTPQLTIFLPSSKNVQSSSAPVLFLSFPTIVSPKGRILAGQEEAVIANQEQNSSQVCEERINLIQNQISVLEGSLTNIQEAFGRALETST